MEAAAKNLTPVLLELGGQNPAFVDPTANIPDAAKKDCLGCDSLGRPVVYFTRIRLCA